MKLYIMAFRHKATVQAKSSAYDADVDPMLLFETSERQSDRYVMSTLTKGRIFDPTVTYKAS